MPRFEFESPEKVFEREEEEKTEEEKLRNFLGEISEGLKREGVPVDKNCRIDINVFRSVYPEEEIKRDEGFVGKREKEWFPGLSKEEIEEEKLKSDGEKLEILKTSIFNKFLGEDFIIVRTSSYDDIKNKVDNVMLEKETGNLICAFDEVGETSGPRYEQKKADILERNSREKGGRLKYGLRLEKDKENKMRLVLGEVTNVPVFYLALPKRFIKEGIEKLIPSFEEKSDYEEKLFSYFVDSFRPQIQSLKLESRLTHSLQEQIGCFEKSLQKIQTKK